MELADVKGYDAILHLAGLSNDPLGYLNPKLTAEINHHASVRIAEFAIEGGCKALHLLFFMQQLRRGRR